MKLEGAAHLWDLYLPAEFAWNWLTCSENWMGNRERHRQTSWLYQFHFFGKPSQKQKLQSRGVCESIPLQLSKNAKKKKNKKKKKKKKKKTKNKKPLWYYEISLPTNNEIMMGIIKKETRNHNRQLKNC